jgi:multidrug efflux system outer membrane protein
MSHALSGPPALAWLKFILAGCLALFLAGCAWLESAPRFGLSPDRPAPAEAPAAPFGWWMQLQDPAIDALAPSALVESPTLAQALARIDEARAALGVANAQRLPAVGASASLTRARSLDTSSGSAAVTSSAAAGPSISWELDLFGRLRQSRRALQHRLDARSADAAGTRLALAAEVAVAVLELRACEATRHSLAESIASRETTLALVRRRLHAGFAAPLDEARAISSLAAARLSMEAQAEQCVRHLNALVALGGHPAGAVRALLALPLPWGWAPEGGAGVLPVAPDLEPRLPATVLAAHPSVVAAARDADAAWADIAVARAERLPRLDLTALLAGQWLHAAGSTLRATTWSLGPALSASVYDGGGGAARVSAAEARHRAAQATLQAALRAAVQDLENALGAAASADARRVLARQSVDAARTALAMLQAQWQAGAVSLVELEDARREFVAAQDSAIAATRDRALAWVALVRASGHVPFTAAPTHEPSGHDEERRLAARRR